MKETMEEVQELPGSQGTCTGVLHTDVVIIGNGPSGICLSYLLSGNWPYVNNHPHPNPILEHKLRENQECSILQQDLQYLSEGLEGRSNNPVALLMDTLCHPNADLGMDEPSCLQWNHHPARNIPHVVLGRGPPGGAWHNMDGSMLTLSLGNWMELPQMDFRHWAQHHRRSQHGGVNCARQDRAYVSDVAQYYSDYVKHMGLESNFLVGSTVTSVRRLVVDCAFINQESGEQEASCQLHRPECCRMNMWEVRGVLQVGDLQQPFCYHAPHVVMATGTTDIPNRLDLTTGDGDDQVIVHDLREIEKAIANRELDEHSDPVMVVGAGLTAADAILCLRSCKVPVVHVFRRDVKDQSLIFRTLPDGLYPEYHKVYQMMKSKEGYPGYKSYPRHEVVELRAGRKCVLKGPSRRGLIGRIMEDPEKVVPVSKVLVLIGARPNLSFLGNNGMEFAVDSTKQVSCKKNPIDVDPYTFESAKARGLYAVGPLAGDNFVRFVKGGPLGIASHLVKTTMENNNLTKL
ncbi:oxidative stress-induced growth inhibitor 1-like isoform X2 [Branchiostoma floridae]|uniref:Oxidative stress-induced growth inhibitor 1-like isoform X2 n=1 Tax=Branchiostoma floridae TaxID=7739 RepID=A0A9J7LAG5_BRAFL|nr:oxidative stress-induced growth inhibitor 1-like isoform X2 [Branchiostoma floridae]